MKETQETWIRTLDQEDTLEEEMATHSSIPAWKTPWTEKPGGLQSMGVIESGTTEHRSQSRFCTHISPIPGQGLVSTKHDCFCRTHLGDKGTCLGSATPPGLVSGRGAPPRRRLQACMKMNNAGLSQCWVWRPLWNPAVILRTSPSQANIFPHLSSSEK